jgi:glutamyl-tRNA reductase
MSNINEVVDSIKVGALEMAKGELKQLLTEARSSATDMVRDTGAKITEWLRQRAEGSLSDQELEALLYSRDQYLRQAKNTLEIKARADVERIATGLINLVLDKVLGLASW